MRLLLFRPFKRCRRLAFLIAKSSVVRASNRFMEGYGFDPVGGSEILLPEQF